MHREEFAKLSTVRQLQILKCDGTFLANRMFTGYIVSLFSLHGFYVEMWKRVGLSSVDYIEVVREQSILDRYLDNLDVLGDLEL